MIEIPKDFPWRPGMLVQACAIGPFGATPAWRITAVVQPPEPDDDGDMVFAVGVNIADVHDAYDLVDIDSPDFPDRPDPNDSATLGALLGAVREAYGSTAHLVRFNTNVWTADRSDTERACWWALATGLTDQPLLVTRADGTGYFLAGPSEFTALLAAWNARPHKEIA